jgi:predicted peptidase
MKQAILFICVLEMIMLSGCDNQAKQRSQIDTSLSQSVHTLNREVTLQLEYLLYLPEGYEGSQKEWPLLVFLHGLGERGPVINKVKTHGPPKLIEQGKQLPFIVVSPQCPENSWWTYETEKVLALVDEIEETYRVDKSRVYLTGLSMGAYGTWAVASVAPDRFAAIAPICGGGYSFLGDNLKDVPVWAFHGGADPVVPVQKSQEMVNAVNQAGGHAKLTIYPGVGHDSWTETYNNDELYQWFLSHSKKQD